MTKIEKTPLSNRHGMPVELERFLIGSAVKMIRVFQGDLTQTNESYDTVVCSAYKGNYLPLPSQIALCE